jgi:hypothetical protein
MSTVTVWSKYQQNSNRMIQISTKIVTLWSKYQPNSKSIIQISTKK